MLGADKARGATREGNLSLTDLGTIINRKDKLSQGLLNRCIRAAICGSDSFCAAYIDMPMNEVKKYFQMMLSGYHPLSSCACTVRAVLVSAIRLVDCQNLCADVWH
eukprot:993309-Rhodomonas_salina.1